MQKRYIGLFLAALVMLPGCIQVPIYKKRSLKNIDATTGYRYSNQGVQLQSKRLTREDKAQLFGGRSKKLYSKTDGNIEVIYFSLHNLSSADYLLSSTSIDLEIMPHQKITKLMKTDTFGRVLGVIASIFGGSLITFASYHGLSALFQSRIPTLGLFVPGFWFGGMKLASMSTDRSYSSAADSVHSNRMMEEDLAEKTSHEDVLVASGDMYEWIIFVKSADFSPQFSVAIRDKNNKHKKLVFDIDLQAALDNVSLEISQ